MNKRGFTLIELLAIIVILGIIAAIAAPNINKQITSKEEKEKTLLKQKIENASKLYAAKYYADDIINGNTKTFTLNNLVEDGILNLSSSECAGEMDDQITFSTSGTDYNNLSCYSND